MKKFLAGMVKDPERVDQPDGTYRDALNANLYVQKGAITNEYGTVGINTTIRIINLIGECVLEDGRIVLFSKAIGTQETTLDTISIVDPKANTHVPVYRTDDLNFQVENTIEATAKVGNNNDILVYFTDNYVDRQIEPNTGISYLNDYNPPRVFNLTKQLEYINSINNPNYGVLYGVEEYSVDKLDLFLSTGDIPEFGAIKIEEGGGVVSGTYHLALAYVDDENNITNYMATSNAVHLVTAPEDSIPTELITGDPQGSQSNKSITWRVSFPQAINYKYVQPVIIQRFGGGQNQESSEFAYSLQKIEIPAPGASRSLEITYTGLENVAQAGVSEVVIDRVRYESAKTLVQLDNKLFLSNLQSRGDLGYQRFANNITLEPVIDRLGSFDPRYYSESTLTEGYNSLSTNDDVYDIQKFTGVDSKLNSNVKKGYKDSNLSYKYKSFRRSEVYAFYISFVLKDGTESYAYHIPGRASLDSGRVPETASISDILDDYQNLNEFEEFYPDALAYQVLDTHQIVDSDMSYWENANETYPNTDDFDVWSVDNDGDPSNSGDSLRNENVRHHKFPSNKSEFSYISINSSNELNPNGASQTTQMLENINILGIKLGNIRIPKFILKQVQGYKIYYAKRKQEHKTIIGQSAIVPAAFRKLTTITTTLEAGKTGPFSPGWLSLGTIPPNKFDYLAAYSENGDLYRDVSAFSFHDFNLLKNKHTLTGASHIDIQKIMYMRVFSGTDGRKPNEEDNGNFYVPEWVNAELGNIVDGDDSVTAFITYALLCHGYVNPGDLNITSLLFAELSDSNVYSEVLDNLNSIYTIRPKSITYLPGLTILTNDSAYSFKGVDTIFNFAGESQIFTNLVKGPPAILARSSGNSIPSNTLNAPWYDPEAISRRTSLKATHSDYDRDNQSTSPLVYLANLVAYKTDVFKPFDEQNLVWTGYFKSLSDVDLESGDATKENYYTGAESDSIFGGDTYIGRYGFRTTGQTYGGLYNRQSVTIDYDVDIINYSLGNLTPQSTLYYFVCESDDLLGFRHSGDSLEGITTDQSRFFDYDAAADVIFNSPVNDGTKSDNLLYMTNYSLNQDIRVTVPYPKTNRDITFFPTRTIRSNNDASSGNDKYRQFLALEFKDLPKNRGDIWKLFTLGAVLYMHTERSLFVTTGKDNLQIGDQTQAFIGSGDIFSQDPQEVISTNTGYGGTDSQYTGVTTRYGHFYFNRRDKKAYIMTDSIIEASSAGMEKWFLENTDYTIENDYDINLEESGVNLDSPTSGFGFHAGYDPVFKRILLTKRERIGTNQLVAAIKGDIIVVENNWFYTTTGQRIEPFNNEYFQDSGWTLSYYPEIKVWGSRHSYLPVLYCNTPSNFYSLINFDSNTNTEVWEHSSDSNNTNFYNQQYEFEFEYIDNTAPQLSKIFSSIYYHMEILDKDRDADSQFRKVTFPGFNSFYVYNSTQISDITNIDYLTNSRLVDRMWYINSFRDLTQYNGNYPIAETMFLEEGRINPDYINNNKPWFEQKRFVDNYLGIRLIANTNNLIYLYGAGTKHRQSFR
jgi:hypothetical protein